MARRISEGACNRKWSGHWQAGRGRLPLLPNASWNLILEKVRVSRVQQDIPLATNGSRRDQQSRPVPGTNALISEATQRFIPRSVPIDGKCLYTVGNSAKDVLNFASPDICIKLIERPFRLRRGWAFGAIPQPFPHPRSFRPRRHRRGPAAPFGPTRQRSTVSLGSSAA